MSFSVDSCLNRSGKLPMDCGNSFKTCCPLAVGIFTLWVINLHQRRWATGGVPASEHLTTWVLKSQGCTICDLPSSGNFTGIKVVLRYEMRLMVKWLFGGDIAVTPHHLMFLFDAVEYNGRFLRMATLQRFFCRMCYWSDSPSTAIHWWLTVQSLLQV